MVVKRPKLDGGAAPKSDKASDVELMEHLVKKSLDVNPELRNGKSTAAVLDSLRQEALGRSKQGTQKAAPALQSDDKAVLAEKRKSAIAFFCEQKAKEYEEASRELTAKEAALRKEREALNKRIGDELADFLGMLSGAADNPETREVLRSFKNFLLQLGVTDADLLQRVRRR